MDLNKGRFLGTLSKTYGTKGYLILKINPDLIDDLQEKELVIVEINNKPIPFFIEELEIRNNRSVLVKFLDYESENTIKEFVGHKVFFEAEKQDVSNHVIFDDITGFQVHDIELGHIGVILEIIEYPKNKVIKVLYEGKEFMIPYSGEIILNIDKKRKILQTNCPDGLIDING